VVLGPQRSPGPERDVCLQNPLGFIKLQITNSRVPLAGVDVRLSDGQWHSMKRWPHILPSTITQPPFPPPQNHSFLVMTSGASTPLAINDQKKCWGCAAT